MERAPNTFSPQEVRRVIQRLRKGSDAQEDFIAAINTTLGTHQTEITGLDGRIDAIEAASDSGYTAEAIEGIAAGMPVFGVSGLPQAGLARADTLAKSRVIGVAWVAAESGYAVTFGDSGKLELLDWTAIAGSAGLTPNAIYYLGNSGGITTIAPTASGLFLVEIGQAVSATVLNVGVKRPILL